MGLDQSNKRGMKSGSEKEASANRHGFEPSPETNPKAGAFGKGKGTAGGLGHEGAAHRTEKAERAKVDES